MTRHTCPHCSAVREVPNHLVGWVTECLTCGRLVEVPDPSGTAPNRAAAAGSTPLRRTRPLLLEILGRAGVVVFFLVGMVGVICGLGLISGSRDNAPFLNNHNWGMFGVGILVSIVGWVAVYVSTVIGNALEAPAGASNPVTAIR